MTGVVAAIVDAGGFVLLVNAKLNIVAAGCLSFCIAALVNYALTSQFVFNREATLRRFASFMAGALIGLTVNVSIMFMSMSMLGVPPFAAKLIGIAVAFIVNFLINLHIVFHPKP
ncbi:MAG: GtrA family protein [Hyphomicrobiaceae bacterium]